MTYTVELDPITETTLILQLFENVKNTEELRKQIMSGALECCIVKPELILDPLQVVVAANKALTCKKQTTKSVFTEILFNLSPSTNISQSLQKFGIEDKDKSLLVAVLNKKGNTDNSENILSQVEGDKLDISQIGCISNVQAIRKMYKIGEQEFQNIPPIDSIVSRIATKE